MYFQVHSHLQGLISYQEVQLYLKQLSLDAVFLQTVPNMNWILEDW